MGKSHASQYANFGSLPNVALLIQFAKYWRYLLMLSEASFLTMQKDLVNG